MSNEKFERIEKKFWMSMEQRKKMEAVFCRYMIVDQYGKAPIRNIYYDTKDYYLTRRSIEGPAFKEKLRVRSYGGYNKDSQVYVEIKRKAMGTGYKRRIRVTWEEAERMLNGETIHSENPQIEKEILQFAARYKPKPKVYLFYERIAMYGKEDSSLRITLDMNIRYRMYEEGMSFDLEGEPVLADESRTLMEIKAKGSIPEWLIKALSEYGIYQTSFSKIGTCYTEKISKEGVNYDQQYFINTSYYHTGDYMPRSSSCSRRFNSIDLQI